MSEAEVTSEAQPLLIHLAPVVEMTDEQFYRFCQINRELRIERTAKGDLLIMTPTGGGTGRRNFTLVKLFAAWEETDGTGVGFDSSTGFILPNGATRSPDLAWVRRERLAALSEGQKEGFLPLCPDFVVELRSPGDRLKPLKAKMQEYADHGAELGWLIDPTKREVHVYRPDAAPVRLKDVESVSGDPELPGFVLDLRKVWATDL